MKSRQFLGARIDDMVTSTASHTLSRRGWRPTIMPFTGYGTAEHVRVLGRLVLMPEQPRAFLGIYAENLLNQRGWRNFVAVAVPRTKVTVRVGEDEIDLLTDRSGYFDITVRTQGMTPGWRSVRVLSEGAQPVDAPVHVISPDVDFGLISDIDDTILSTFLPRLFLAAWNSFVRTEGNRQAVPGMARMYQQLLAEHPGAPLVYVSTGAWNTLPFLRRFMKRHGFPPGPMLMTDIGPTQNSWMRSGREHKRRSLAELARDFPNIRWVLIGDDGQHDPVIYREFAELRPGRVRAIAIRNLSAHEQMLAHGTATVLRDSADLAWMPPVVPEVSGETGDEIAPRLRAVLEDSSQ